MWTFQAQRQEKRRSEVSFERCFLVSTGRMSPTKSSEAGVCLCPVSIYLSNMFVRSFHCTV